MRNPSTFPSGYMLVMGLSLSAAVPALARDDAQRPPAVQPCNDACRWWMAIGQKPAPEPVPAASVEPVNPRQSMKAIVPQSVEPPAKPISMARFWGPHANHELGADRPQRAAIHVPVSLTPGPVHAAGRRPAQSMWNMPISGSVPILPAAFVRT